MIKLQKLFLGFTLILLAVSCSSGKSEKTESVPASVSITVSQSEVYGENSGLFCVVPGSYKLKYDDGVKIKVRLKLEQTVEKKIEGVSGLILRLKDEDGMGLVDGYSQMTLADGETDKMITFLSSEPGTEQDFVFVNEFGDEYAEDVMTKTTSFSLENLSVTYVGDSDQQLEDLENGINSLGKAMKGMNDIMETSNEMLDASKKSMDMINDIYGNK